MTIQANCKVLGQDYESELISIQHFIWRYRFVILISIDNKCALLTLVIAASIVNPSHTENLSTALANRVYEPFSNQSNSSNSNNNNMNRSIAPANMKSHTRIFTPQVQRSIYGLQRIFQPNETPILLFFSLFPFCSMCTVFPVQFA